MGDILVIVEHRNGEISDSTFQVLGKAHELCKDLSLRLTAVLLGSKDEPFINSIAERADRVLSFEDESLKVFNGELYAEIIKNVIDEEKPFLTLISHTPWGMDYAPALSIKTGFPLASDCVDLLIEDINPKAIRQIYGGKLLSKVGFKESDGYILTIRPGAYSGDKVGDYQGEVIKKDLPTDISEARKQFVEFVDTAAGAVDISQADLLVSIGRGIAEADNIGPLKELADKMGGTLSCSRPVVDKGWLPKFHQVGTSGKSVKPKVYLAFGISGSFQHVAGISGAGTIIAVNKDKKAPIFRVADYGIIDDLFKVSEALAEKMG